MADDRVSRETAELIPLPPHTWYVRTIGWMLEQEKVKENIANVPPNQPLIDSLRQHGVKSPILCMPNWYPHCRLSTNESRIGPSRDTQPRNKSLPLRSGVVAFILPMGRHRF